MRGGRPIQPRRPVGTGLVAGLNDQPGISVPGQARYIGCPRVGLEGWLMRTGSALPNRLWQSGTE